MSSINSTIYDHMPYLEGLTKGVSRCACGAIFGTAGKTAGRADWAAHLADIIYRDFINVTYIPAGPAAPPQPVEEVAEVSILINGELHSVIYAKPRRAKA